MQIIIISPNQSTAKHWTLTLRQLVLASIVLLVSFAYAVYFVSQKAIMQSAPAVEQYSSIISELDDLLEQNNNQLQKQTKELPNEVPKFYAKRLGALQAESIRLKAITEQLAKMTGFDLSNFSLEKTPPQGGIKQRGTSLTNDSFERDLELLSNEFDEHSHLLQSMQTYLVAEDAIESTIPSRRPIDDGWLSSNYGNRIDPFNGKITFHRGIDFAGKDGGGIFAVADGLVSRTGRRSGYGETVEIDHGNGYVTRYAHSKKLLVNLGDKVAKGQKIALIGSTGRSTGPHVHFELLRAGRNIDPSNFIKE